MSLSAVAVVISAMLVASGWIVSHQLSLRQSALERRRDLRLQYQIEAYRSLMHCINSDINSRDDFAVFERCVNDIMLFGSQEQVEIVRDDINGEEIVAGRLLINIRNGLREELGLPREDESGGWGMTWTDSEDEVTPT